MIFLPYGYELNKSIFVQFVAFADLEKNETEFASIINFTQCWHQIERPIECKQILISSVYMQMCALSFVHIMYLWTPYYRVEKDKQALKMELDDFQSQLQHVMKNKV